MQRAFFVSVIVIMFFCFCEYMLCVFLSFVFVNTCYVVFFSFFFAYSLPKLTTEVCKRLILFFVITWSICWLTLKEPYIYLLCLHCVIKDNDYIQMEVHFLFIVVL